MVIRGSCVNHTRHLTACRRIREQLRLTCLVGDGGSTSSTIDSHTPTRLFSSSTRSTTTSSASSSSSSSASSTSSSSDLAFPSHLPRPGPYDIFHLPRSASQAQVKARYYDLVKLLHPDRRTPSSSPQGVFNNANTKSTTTTINETKGKSKIDPEQEIIVEEFRQVVKAYELLSDTERRRTFDMYGLGWNAEKPWFGGMGPTPHERDELQRRRAFSSSTSRAADRMGFSSSTGNAEPRYTSNIRFIAAVALVTFSIASLHFQKVGSQSEEAVVQAGRRHLDAVGALEEAQRRARTEEGRRRFEALKGRAQVKMIVEEGG